MPLRCGAGTAHRQAHRRALGLAPGLSLRLGLRVEDRPAGPPARRGARGVALLEVLLALILLSLGTMALMQFVWRSTKDSAYAQHRTKAALLAQEKMDEIQTDPAFLQAATYASEPQPFKNQDGAVIHPAFRWRARTAPARDGKGLAEVAVYVEWEGGPGVGPRSGSFELPTLVPGRGLSRRAGAGTAGRDRPWHRRK